MKKLYDTTKYECYICGHRWIIRSNRLITSEQVTTWLKESILEHIIIHKDINK